MLTKTLRLPLFAGAGFCFYLADHVAANPWPALLGAILFITLAGLLDGWINRN